MCPEWQCGIDLMNQGFMMDIRGKPYLSVWLGAQMTLCALDIY